MKKIILGVLLLTTLTSCLAEKESANVTAKDGTNGVNGTNGKDGLNGRDGQNGDKGDKGDKGDVGLAGTNGLNGVNGLNLYFNSGVPNSTLGVNNESYLDQTTLNLYKKINNVWVLQGSIKGTTGATGSSGSNGLNFLSGPSAPTGSVGVNGELYYDINAFNLYQKTNNTWMLISNLKGPKGDKGDVGMQGVQGVVGPTGAIGATGQQGVAGTQGPKGDTGAAGANGAQGVKGDKGDTGPQGVAGPAGPQGPKGDAGTSGSSLVIYSNIPQGTCHPLTSGVYVWNEGSNVWFKMRSDCNHGSNDQYIYCQRVSQLNTNGDSHVCWIGRKQYTVMGTGSNLKIYEVTFN